MDCVARWIATGLSAIAFTAFLTGCSEPAAPLADKPRPVKLFTLTDPGAERIREFPARLKAPEEAQLSFRLGGELQSLKVHEGQEVKRGELIALLDDTDYRLKLSDRQASYDLTRSQLTRMEQLVERQMVSQAEYDQRKAQFNSAEAALNLARQELAYTRINAPFDGVVARTHVEQFQVVQPNQPIATLYSGDSIDVVFQVPENLFSNLRRDLQPKDLVARVRLENLQNTLIDAVYKEYASQPDPSTLAYDVTLSMPIPEGMVLLPGMSATVIIDFARITRNTRVPMVVPVEAVFSPDSQGSDARQVWVINEQDGGLRVSARSVIVGQLTNDGIEVLSGLEAGEQIVAAGGNELSEGQPVRPWIRERGL
ncbi:efflux RND transporter periplasmic adaptor subunit [Halopseudomonas maritima]|uniref:efflux RND transporter periplasmic adaptor subunit n=1 Tax=Halopseudomonas maritima TaxID=2918528 RepID=UPI001EEBEF35|nr:efflux RND transporter periplasmic adaptor subunit [Halopseudomonas maritima]UJJ33066.1 efflux RND transporter periplasmic adaptor subunit [Halopseudomonas maritima]